MNVTHLYGLTETFGPAVLCEWRGDWNQWPRGAAGAESRRVRAWAM